MSKKPKYIIHDNAVYEITESELFSSYKRLAVPQEKPTPQWHGPLIPWDMWCELVAWCQVTQEKFKSEALAFLFFDLDKKEWKHWYPPQITNGMTVQADDDSEEYKLQRKHFPDLQFGSLHHHCTSQAFASGTDHADEIDRDGFHFTVGNIGSKEHSAHFRLCLDGTCHELHPASVIEPSPDVAQLPEKYRMMVHSKMILEPQDTKLWDFTEPLKNISKKNPTLNYQPSRRDSGRTGIGGRTNTKNGPNTSDSDRLDPKKDTPFKVLSDLNEQELSVVCGLLQDSLWAYGFTTDSECQKPVSRCLTVFKTRYKKPEKSEDKKEFMDDVTLSLLEFFGFDTNDVATKKEIDWMHGFIACLKNKLTNE